MPRLTATVALLLAVGGVAACSSPTPAVTTSTSPVSSDQRFRRSAAISKPRALADVPGVGVTEPIDASHLQSHCGETTY
jgi:hypothetical protein